MDIGMFILVQALTLTAPVPGGMTLARHLPELPCLPFIHAVKDRPVRESTDLSHAGIQSGKSAL